MKKVPFLDLQTQYQGKSAGTIGDVGCCSFYPGKNLGAYGEAGAIITGNRTLAEKIRQLTEEQIKYVAQELRNNYSISSAR